MFTEYDAIYIFALQKVVSTEPLFSGFRLCLRGCNANNGVQSGSAALNVNNAVSDANVNWGSPLNFSRTKLLVVLRPRPLAKNKLKAGVLVDWINYPSRMQQC